jgi:hypothetical protein
MPAKSQQQLKFFYAVKNYKESLKGKRKKPKVSKAIKDAAKSMSMKQINDFLESRKKDLPERVKQADLEVIESLVKMANHLDELGLSSESDLIDSILVRLSK